MSRFQGPFTAGTREAYQATAQQAEQASPGGVVSYNPAYWLTQQGQAELRTRNENDRRRQLSGLSDQLGPQGREVLEAVTPLYERGVIDERDMSRLMAQGIDDAVNNRRDRFSNLGAINEDMKAIAKLQSPQQMQQATQQAVKKYGAGAINQTPWGQRVLGTEAEIQRRQAQQQAEQEARIREGMQRYGMDPDTLLGLDKQGKPIYSIPPSDQRMFAEAKAKIEQQERSGSREEQRFYYDQLQQHRKNRPEFDRLSAQMELAGQNLSSNKLQMELERRERAFGLQEIQWRAQEEELQRRAFGMDFNAAVEPVTDTALGPVSQQRVFDVMEVEKPEVPAFQSGDGAESAFAAGKIAPFTPFRVNGVLVEFDENGQARRVQ